MRCDKPDSIGKDRPRSQWDDVRCAVRDTGYFVAALGMIGQFISFSTSNRYLPGREPIPTPTTDLRRGKRQKKADRNSNGIKSMGGSESGWKMEQGKSLVCMEKKRSPGR
ncbi:hypothetical protein BOTCAL_0582g00040 [Botryotinia calthae]|uniref:Uncharacterized protein n=1 Tax=Botryotinia calthae TaxID=38488 RepID=A0A4Y8CL34_9HELO|nr:hypothetical protein BOTCAL_0582g00040 [Botryotinia calthae]